MKRPDYIQDLMPCMVPKLVEYIEQLENQLQVKTASLLHEVSGNQHLTNVIKSMTDIQRYRNLSDQEFTEQLAAEQAAEQRKQLDQFASSLQPEVYKQVMHEHTFGLLAKEYDGMNVYQITAKRTYDIAEAMQAESQKRSGGEV